MRAARIGLAALFLAYAGAGLLYIQRTSVVVEGQRIYCLWDDAMISMRFARHLAEGHGLVWNVGQRPVQGFSNPGVTLIMAGLHRLPFRLEHVAGVFQVVALGFLLASLWLAWATARRWAGPAAAAGTVVAVATFAPLTVWALQGSDVGPVAALLWLVLWLVTPPAGTGPPARIRAGLASLGAGILVRPDTVLMGLVFLGWLATDRRVPRRALAEGAAILGGALGVVLLLGTWYYGDPLPNTLRLKLGGLPWWLLAASGADQLAQILRAFPPAALALATGLGTVALFGPRDRLSVLCLGWLAAGLAYAVGAGGDWLPGQGLRFVIPVVPPALMVFAAAVSAGARRLAPAAPRWAVAGGVVLVAPWLALSLSARAPILEWIGTMPPLLQEISDENVRLGLYLRDRTWPETTVAYHWAGTPAYYAERPGIDVFGRVDRHIARVPAARSPGGALEVPGHARRDWDYVLKERRPDVVLTAAWGIEAHPDFRRHYLAARTAGGLAFYVRRDATERLRDGDVQLRPLSPGG